MDIIIETVKKLGKLLEHSGCESGDVLLDVNPDCANCKYERGACMTALFGGRSADYTTFEPIRARTKISFMFGAPLDTPPTRAAACAIINAAAGFFCLSRVLHACMPSSHDACESDLKTELAGKRIWCMGDIPGFSRTFLYSNADSLEEADVILIGAEGLIAEGTGDLIEKNSPTKRILFIGPSTAGTARIHNLEHWCPYGRS